MNTPEHIAEMNKTCQNTDRELWREPPGDYYANSIHVTARGGIGINVGGTVTVKSLTDWHGLLTVLAEREREILLLTESNTDLVAREAQATAERIALYEDTKELAILATTGKEKADV